MSNPIKPERPEGPADADRPSSLEGPPAQPAPDPDAGGPAPSPGPPRYGMPPSGAPVFGPPKRDLHLASRYTRWTLWSCLTLVLVGVLLGAGFLLVWLQRPEGQRSLRMSEDLLTCEDHLNQLSGALERYNGDKGHNPARLEDLYPTYLTDRSFLYCPSDPAAPKDPKTAAHAAEKTSYILREWVPWGSGDRIVVFCPHHPAPIGNKGLPKDQWQYVAPVIRANGQVDRIIVRAGEMKGWSAERGPGGKRLPAPASPSE